MNDLENEEKQTGKLAEFIKKRVFRTMLELLKEKQLSKYLELLQAHYIYAF